MARSTCRTSRRWSSNRIGSRNATAIPTAPLWDPRTRETADHSIPYLVAAALLDGDVTEAAFTPERIADPRLRDLMRKIVVRERPEFTAAYPDGWPCRVEIVTKGGARQVADVKYFKGHAQTPLTDSEVEKKFRLLTRPFLDDARAAALIDRLWHLDAATDIRTVLELLHVKTAAA